MSLLLDDNAFERGHQAFLTYMREHSKWRAPFTSYQHDFLVDDEIGYKYAAHYHATAVLQRKRWRNWRKTPGKIIMAVVQACAPKVGRNLLEHRWGGSYEV